MTFTASKLLASNAKLYPECIALSLAFGWASFLA